MYRELEVVLNSSPSKSMAVCVGRVFVRFDFAANAQGFRIAFDPRSEIAAWARARCSRGVSISIPRSGITFPEGMPLGLSRKESKPSGHKLFGHVIRFPSA